MPFHFGLETVINASSVRACASVPVCVCVCVCASVPVCVCVCVRACVFMSMCNHTHECNSMDSCMVIYGHHYAGRNVPRWHCTVDRSPPSSSVGGIIHRPVRCTAHVTPPYASNVESNQGEFGRG